MSDLLSPLIVGDQVPVRLSADSEPEWLTVIEIVSDASYIVRYPDGMTETLVDSE